MDHAYPAGSRFKGRVAHGGLTASFASAANTPLTGSGFVCLGQEPKLLAPVRINDPVTATPELPEVRGDKQILRARTSARTPHGELVADGLGGLKRLLERLSELNMDAPLHRCLAPKPS